MKRHEEPVELGDVLNALAGRLRRVDLRLIDRARALWPDVVDSVLAEHCRVELIRDGVLVVSVPSGAFAERVLDERPAILAAYSSFGAAAPTSIRTVVAAH